MADPALRTPDPVLKVVPRPGAERRKVSLVGVFKQYRRVILLCVLPLLAGAIALTVYLMGGRYISTDNAYVGAQKVLITPDVAGKINRIDVIEGQHVEPGDLLFEIDPVPFQLAVTQAESRLAMVRTDFDNLKTNLKSLTQLIQLARQTVELKESDVERKSKLLASHMGSALDADTAMVTLAAARTQVELLAQQEARIRNQLLGDANLPIEKYPAYQQAKAALDQAKRDLEHTVLHAPISGRATQVDSIQLGRYVTAGTPVFSVVDDQRPWVDANPKETDITYLQLGQKAWIHVDTFPGHVFHGTVIAVSAGTGAQFAILPPQNASGNWVKVVQRVPTRIAFDSGQNLSKLRSGMSATVDIDTRRQRNLGSLFGRDVSIAVDSDP
ncbi:MAG: HlyD family secretion protein [Xanthobacteraceae bacterium]|jgi:membrane fusion protein (multidrug efflux system)